MRPLLAIAALAACSCIAADDWGPVQFLIGSWTGEGGGGLGQGSGAFSFTPDLQGKILLRKNYAEYPVADGKPASRHDDLMIVYREAGALKAIYFDSEEHTIRYAVKAAANGVAFVSEDGQPGPRYRMTMTADGKDRVKIRFEIAPPGKDFATYIEAAARRVAR